MTARPCTNAAGGGGSDVPPTRPFAGSAFEPADIVHVYRPGANPVEFHVHAIPGPVPLAAATRRPLGPFTVMFHGSADESRPANVTGPPIFPRTPGA